MVEVKTFKLEKKFKNIEDLYKYLLKNVDYVSGLVGIDIQKPLKDKTFRLVGREKITERNVLFFASENEFPENLGKLIALASTFNTDIMVFFTVDAGEIQLKTLNWLQNICNEDTQIIVGIYESRGLEADDVMG